MGSNSREHILEGALAMLQSGGTVSLESAARRAGLSKPGVMYHFPTKEALMLALVDSVVDGWEHELSRRMTVPVDRASAPERVRAYLDWSLSGEIDQGYLVMLADPRLRDHLTSRWAERLSPWLDLPAELSATERARLSAVRLIADGICFGDACGVFTIEAEERDDLRKVADEILGDPV